MIIRLLPTYIHLFMDAQNAQPFSLECTKVKLLILNNFDIYYVKITIKPNDFSKKEKDIINYFEICYL